MRSFTTVARRRARCAAVSGTWGRFALSAASSSASVMAWPLTVAATSAAGGVCANAKPMSATSAQANGNRMTDLLGPAV